MDEGDQRTAGKVHFSDQDDADSSDEVSHEFCCPGKHIASLTAFYHSSSIPSHAMCVGIGYLDHSRNA